MQKIILLVTILSVTLGNSQAFTGVNDNKLQLGANLQSSATGVNISFDYGLGENISVGLSSSYSLGISDDVKIYGDDADRFDLKARFNANLGNVINVDDNFDVYPGLNLSLKNFGGHLGARYFFSEGFGVYTEFNVPLAKYKVSRDIGEELHNQFTVNLGAVFNL